MNMQTTGIVGYRLGLYRDNGNKMETRGFIGIIGYRLGLYRDNGKKRMETTGIIGVI